jgi:hypothetical protein
MKDKEMTLMDWQKQFGTEDGCAQGLSNAGREVFAAHVVSRW